MIDEVVSPGKSIEAPSQKDGQSGQFSGASIPLHFGRDTTERLTAGT